MRTHCMDNTTYPDKMSSLPLVQKYDSAGGSGPGGRTFPLAHMKWSLAICGRRYIC
jgi:hypothetical protein